VNPPGTGTVAQGGPVPSAGALEVLDQYAAWHRTPEGEAYVKELQHRLDLRRDMWEDAGKESLCVE